MNASSQTSIGALCDAGLVELQTGPFGSQLHSYDYVPNGIPVVPTEALRERRIDKAVCPRISKDKARELSRHSLNSGDILFARRGVQATGHIGVVRDDEAGFVCGTGAIRLRVGPNDTLSAEYLSHLLADPSSIAWFKHHAVGATMPNLNEGIIRSFPLWLPSLQDQHEIAGLLSALDDKIELNRRTNETLEAMAQAIFRDWFVDFGPVRRKTEGATDPVAIMGGLTTDPTSAAELAALFPSSMDGDETPDGYAFATLGEATSTFETGTRPRGGISGILNGVPSIGAESVVGLAKFDFGKTKFVPREFFASMKRGIVGPRDILLYKDGGRPGEFEPHIAMFGAGFPFNECCINEHVYRLVAKPPFSQEYLFFHLTSETSMEEMRNKGTGVAVPGLNSTAARSLVILHPGELKLEAFTRFARPLVDRALNNAIENRTLAETRDYLLPRLMSGQVRVGEAAEIVKPAA